MPERNKWSWKNAAKIQQSIVLTIFMVSQIHSAIWLCVCVFLFCSVQGDTRTKKNTHRYACCICAHTHNGTHCIRQYRCIFTAESMKSFVNEIFFRLFFVVVAIFYPCLLFFFHFGLYTYIYMYNIYVTIQLFEQTRTMYIYIYAIIVIEEHEWVWTRMSEWVCILCVHWIGAARLLKVEFFFFNALPLLFRSFTLNVVYSIELKGKTNIRITTTTAAKTMAEKKTK